MRASDPALELDMLCRVVGTAWLYGPASFLEDVAERTGRSFEGEVGYAWQHEEPSELGPGVTLFYLGQEMAVPEELFADFARAYAEAWLEAAECLDVPTDPSLVRKLRGD
jgi:hypothetical protein